MWVDKFSQGILFVFFQGRKYLNYEGVCLFLNGWENNDLWSRLFVRAHPLFLRLVPDTFLSLGIK